MVAINFLYVNQNLSIPQCMESVASDYVCFPNQAVKTFAGKIV